jgi:hypothetical protein
LKIYPEEGERVISSQINLDCLGLTNFAGQMFVVCCGMGLELRGFTLSHSTSPIFVKGFSRKGLENYLPRLAANCDPPDFYLLSS